MNVAYDQNNNIIHTEFAFKGKTYLCPNCKEVVVRAGGGIQRAHFRHKVGGKYEACELFIKGLENEVNLYQRDIYEDNNVLFFHEMSNLVETVDYRILSYEIEDLKRKKTPLYRSE